MRVEITEYGQAHVEEVAEFNRRLRAGGVPSAFPTRPTSEWLPPVPGRRLFQEQFVALDEEGIVRGGYILKHQDFKLGEEVVDVGDFRLPISEGTVNRNYALVTAQLIAHAFAKNPLLYGLGIGGWNVPAARMAKASGWLLLEIPFFFRVNHPARFLHGIPYLRKRWYRRVLLDLAAFTGAGWVGLKAIQTLRKKYRPTERLSADQVDEFDAWADELWSQCREQYPMIAVRDSKTLRILYPKDDPRFIRLRVREEGKVVGWCVLLATQFRDHKQFGALKVGSFIDGLASVGDATKVVAAATAELDRRAVDLIVSNHSHRDWCAAFDASGYLRGPSNFLFAASRKLAQRLEASEIARDAIYLNRGDGDGPIHL
ncbi:MAG TPA: hypothetical protein VMY37_12220 [Thermoguttaceae bacterium]|nr:hypothetical protein [Thermoguttaceae bacterium]